MSFNLSKLTIISLDLDELFKTKIKIILDYSFNNFEGL